MTDNLKDRAARCVTHHAACDCREYAYRERIERLEGALRGLMERGDFWIAVAKAGIALPGEVDDCTEALADDGAGGGEQAETHPVLENLPGVMRLAVRNSRRGGDPITTDRVEKWAQELEDAVTDDNTSPQHRDALEALQVVKSLINSPRCQITQKEWTGYRSLLDDIHQQLTAPPTVPEALERALRDIAESDITSDPEMDAQELQSIARLALTQHSEPGRVAEATVDKMVDRFLSWDLPPGFSPDGGIEFNPIANYWPTGTNLFCYEEAKEMVNHLLAAAPAPDADEREWVMQQPHAGYLVIRADRAETLNKLLREKLEQAERQRDEARGLLREAWLWVPPEKTKLVERITDHLPPLRGDSDGK